MTGCLGQDGDGGGENYTGQQVVPSCHCHASVICSLNSSNSH